VSEQFLNGTSAHRRPFQCQPDMWPVDIDDMAAMYESELAAMLDRLIPFREVTCSPRTSDPWFDKDCL